MRAISLWKEADNRLVKGIGQVTDYSEEFVKTLMKCFRTGVNSAEFVTQLNTKIRARDQ